MIILGVETSCDETAMAILKIEGSKFIFLAELISSQVKIHQKYGGIYPYLAKREHSKNLPIVLAKVLKKSNYPQLDLISVTVGPGLEPCLFEGVNFAKALAKKLKIPLVAVNHLKAHIIISFFKEVQKEKIFPAIGLVVSGGHTVLFLCKNLHKFELLGQTRDDAVGECFDKIGRLFSFSYPAGPKITTFLKLFKNKKLNYQISLPRPMIFQRNFDFSFSGLKTAVLYLFQKTEKKIRETRDFKLAVFRELERAIEDVLIKKTITAAKQFKVKSVLLGGGVAADDFLRERFKKVCQKEKLKIFLPPKKYCGDNASMIALTGFFELKLRGPDSFSKLKPKANLIL